MAVLIVTDPAVLTVTAPDGTPVTATMAAGDPMYSTVYGNEALFVGGIGRTILTLTVGDIDDTGVDPYLHEDFEKPSVESETDLLYSPVTPSDPFVESRAGAVAVTWDGLGAGGEAMPVNLYRVEIHRSIEGADFATDATTYAATMYIAGTHVFTDQSYGVEWWYRLVSMDQTGLRSTDSTAMPGTALKIVGADIEANSVTANEIAANTITSVELTSTAIDGMTITGALIRTVASGARWEMGTTGPAYALSNRLIGYTGHALEETPALIESSAEVSAGGINAGLRLMSPDITPGATSIIAKIDIESLDPSIGANSSLITLSADKTQIVGPAQINGVTTLLDTLNMPSGRAMASCGGTFTIPAINNGASSGSTAVSFPAGANFASAPAVTVTSGSARLGMAIVSVTTTGFTYVADNWSGGNAVSNTGHYTAVAV